MKTRGLWFGVLTCAACIVGVRGEASFEARHEIEGVSDLRIDLPSTPIDVYACDATLPGACPDRLHYAGRWRTVAGTPRDARERAEEPEIVFETLDGFAELRAHIPLSVRGTVDLELDSIDVPDDRALEVRTDRGNVRVVGSRAAVAVAVVVGDVEVAGGDGGVGIRVEQGDVTVESAGDVEVDVQEGRIDVTHTAGARETWCRTGRGDIEVTLADDANIDLRVRAAGEIRVRTANVVAITHGSFDRTTGDGALEIHLTTHDGDVTVRDESG